jgi:DNA modification methylase
MELAERLVRMFSFVGDTVLDPFMGTATTNIAAAKWGRNSIGVEVDPHYFEMAHRRFEHDTPKLFSRRTIQTHEGTTRDLGVREEARRDKYRGEVKKRKVHARRRKTTR